MTTDVRIDTPLSLDPGYAADYVTIVRVPRVIEMFSVSERELDQIGHASTGYAFHLVFFGITFGASMAFLISLLTAQLGNRTFALVWALFVLVLATLYFGVQSIRSYSDSRKGVRVIKTESQKIQTTSLPTG
ncbi:MAG TPA: hypothetical protein VJT32_01040 [bacterium]|nr:hypothetical protein [bacterium]